MEVSHYWTNHFAPTHRYLHALFDYWMMLARRSKATSRRVIHKAPIWTESVHSTLWFQQSAGTSVPGAWYAWSAEGWRTNSRKYDNFELRDQTICFDVFIPAWHRVHAQPVLYFYCSGILCLLFEGGGGKSVINLYCYRISRVGCSSTNR